MEVRPLYDSERASKASHQRAGFCLDRVLVFQVEDLSIDLVCQAGNGDLKIYQGQIVRGGLDGPVQGAQVRLGAGGKPVTTDTYGQFAVSCLNDCHRKVIEIDIGDRTLELVIPAVRDSDIDGDGI